jgi:hypothetical protein
MVPKPGGALDFGDETYKGPDGRQVSIATVWRRIDERTYETVTANPAGDRVVRFTRLD